MNFEEKYLFLDLWKKDITKKVIENIDDYDLNKLIIYKDPVDITGDRFVTTRALTHVKKALDFKEYIKIFFENGTSRIYKKDNIKIEKTLLNSRENKQIFNYFKELSNVITVDDIKHDEGLRGKNDKILKKAYEKLTFISEESVLKNYISGEKEFISDMDFSDNNIIFPFSFNSSQEKALENALSNKISVIEGPPGTGKTQTILNMLSNIILNEKTVAVVSNNNAATKNVYEKLEKNGLSSLCARLGRVSNIDKFIESQIEIKPYPNSWYIDNEKKEEIINDLHIMKKDIDLYLEYKNDIAILNQELYELKLEYEHYDKNISNIQEITLPNLSTERLHKFFLYLNKQENMTEYFNKKVQVISQIKYKFFNPELYNNKIKDILENIEKLYYEKKIKELDGIIKEKENFISKFDLEDKFDNYTKLSMKYFKNYVYENYNNKNIYDNTTVKNTNELIKDYPIILSTTYSLLNSISSGYVFDYIIIDESSQVDLASAFLALSSAKNVVIVGDSKQLPNIVSSKKVNEYNNIFNKYEIDKKYNYTENNLLDLTKKIYDDMPITILREHYRCHPKIIEFCNKMFYNNELIILTQNTVESPIKRYKCVKGNHARKKNTSWYNERQADVIINELIPNENINIYKDSIGLVTPYRPQKEYLIDRIDCKNVQIDTVHGFQGSEKDLIIFSTVANDIDSFLDNPNSINVAISRAVNKLYLVTPYEYKSNDNSNISSLIKYINYNNFEEVQSNINSIYDLLYKVNKTKLEEFLGKYSKIFKFNSENVTYYMLKKILKEEKYNVYDVLNNHYPLIKIVKDEKILNDEEIKFIHTNSHIDLLIYNKFDKTPVLAVEVDGYKFHNKEIQKIRDQKKNNILKKCGIPLVRLKTNGSNEEDKIRNILDEIIK